MQGSRASKDQADSILLKRITDMALGVVLLGIFSLPMVIVFVLIRLGSSGSALHWSDRIGANNTVFKMPKFRTMLPGTPAVATHLLEHPERYVTPIGRILRRLSLDELPQLYSVIKGDMSFVGPRPALFNQHDLIDLRTQKNIQRLLPGITGWAQVNGRDELSIPVKVEFDEYYLRHRSLSLDVRILAMTLMRVLRSQGVSH
jgi:O-antigen biosynthesis protein WbqP